MPTCNSIFVNTSRNTTCTGKSISIQSVGIPSRTRTSICTKTSSSTPVQILLQLSAPKTRNSTPTCTGKRISISTHSVGTPFSTRRSICTKTNNSTPVQILLQLSAPKTRNSTLVQVRASASVLTQLNSVRRHRLLDGLERIAGEAVTKEKEFGFCFTARFYKTFKLTHTQGHSRGISVSRPCENAENILLNQDMSRCSMPKNRI